MGKKRIEFMDSEWTEGQAFGMLEELAEKLEYDLLPRREKI